jgi:hypothetical protein
MWSLGRRGQLQIFGQDIEILYRNKNVCKMRGLENRNSEDEPDNILRDLI